MGTAKPNIRLAILSVAILFIFVTAAPAEHLPIKIYTSADGLGSSFVDHLMRDSKGFLWFCSRDGLSRFDGSQFITYQIGEKGAVSGVESIYEDRRGTYWIGTTTGLYRFTSETVSQANPARNARPLLNAEYISNERGQMYEGRNRELWLIADGLFRVKQQDGKVSFETIDLHLPDDLSKGLNISDHAEDADGSIWFNAPKGIVRRLPDGRVIFFQTDLENNQGTILRDRDNRIWSGRGREFFIVEPEPLESLTNLGDFTLRPLKPDADYSVKSGDALKFPERPGECFRFVSDEFLGKHATRRLFESSDGHVWLTTEENLVEFDGDRLHLHTPKEGFVPGMARMAEDSAGNLWFGGYAGLVRLDRKGLITYDAADGLASTNIYSIIEDAAGRLYAATGELSIGQFDGKSFHSVRPKTVPNSSTIWTSRFALLDREGEWWMATQKGLHRFSEVQDFSDLDGKSPSAVYNKSTGLSNNEAFQIFEDEGADIWFSQFTPRADERVLVRWSRATNEFHTFTEDEGFPRGKAVSSFAEDKYGNLWLGFYEGGIARYRDGKFTVFDQDYGLPTGVVTDLLIDKTERLWLSTATGGLMRIDNTSVERPEILHFTTEDGLTSNNIRTITEDNFGRIYLGTVRGVDRLLPDTMRVKHYTVSDGLASDFVVDSHCDKAGILWFATTNGLSRLEPISESNQEAPKVFVGKLLIAGEEQPIPELGSEIVDKGELSSGQNNFQIDFFGLDFRAGERLLYQYKFDGADADWSPPSEQRRVTFAKLSPGAYRFLVRAVNSDGAVSSVPGAVSFQILPPIWARWWFLAICGLLIALIVIGFFSYRVARLREVNEALILARNAEASLRRAREERLAELERVRTRIATDLHDDIGASLTQIAVLSEVARAQGNGGNAGASAPLTKISAVTNELVESMSDIVWSINPAKDHLSDLTQRMRRFASDILVTRGIGIHLHVPEDSDKITIKAGVRRELFLIFKESINNIAKHSSATNVEIDLEVTVVDLHLKISDNGKGFSIGEKTSGDGGNGLLSMKRRAEAINGSLEIVSAPGAGTRLTLTLPLEQTVSP